MNNYDLKKEKEKYSRYDFETVFEKKYNDTTFLLKKGAKYITDCYGEHNNIEISYYEPLDYYVVKNYNMADDCDVLDLTWIDDNCFFNFDKNEQNKHIREIDVNIGSLGYSYLPVGEDMFHDLKLVVYNTSNKNSINSIKGFKSFINTYASYLTGGVQLEEFHPLLESILGKYVKNNKLELIDNSVQKKRVK